MRVKHTLTVREEYIRLVHSKAARMDNRRNRTCMSHAFLIAAKKAR